MPLQATRTVTADEVVAVAGNPGDVAGAGADTVTVELRNATATETIYLGAQGVTSATGFPWDAADGSFSCPLEPGEVLFARLADGADAQEVRVSELVAPAPVPDPLEVSGHVYWGARIDGAFYELTEGADPMDAPWSEMAEIPRPTAWDYFEQHAGSPVNQVNWGGLGSAWPPLNFDTVAADCAWDRGAFSYYGHGFNAEGLADLLANNATAAENLAGVAYGMKLWGHPILHRPLWEMNADWGIPAGYYWQTVHGVTPEDYVTIWRNMWQIFADVMGGHEAGSGLGTDTGNVSFYWCPHVITDFGNSPDPTPWYPGDDYVDWIGWDGYDGYDPDLYNGPAAVYDETYDVLAALAPTKPMGIGEFGVAGTIPAPGKAAWLDDFFTTWLPAHPRVKMISWYNEEYPSVPDVHIEEPADALAAFAEHIAHPRFVNPVNATTFPPGKVPVPS